MPNLWRAIQIRLHRLFKHECGIISKRNVCLIGTVTYITTILVRFSTQSHCHHGCQFHISDFTISSHLRIVSMVPKFYLSSLTVVITDIYSISYVVIFYLYILHFIMYSNCSLHFSAHHESYLHFGFYLLS